MIKVESAGEQCASWPIGTIASETKVPLEIGRQLTDSLRSASHSFSFGVMTDSHCDAARALLKWQVVKLCNIVNLILLCRTNRANSFKEFLIKVIVFWSSAALKYFYSRCYINCLHNITIVSVNQTLFSVHYHWSAWNRRSDKEKLHRECFNLLLSLPLSYHAVSRSSCSLLIYHNLKKKLVVSNAFC